MNDAEKQKIADLLKALGEFNRLSLVYKLCQCQAPQNAMCLWNKKCKLKPVSVNASNQVVVLINHVNVARQPVAVNN